MDAISDPIQTGQAAGPRKSWRDFTRIHEACALIPEMSDAELDALGDDLVKNSLTASIAFTPDGQLLATRCAREEGCTSRTRFQ
jgi:hypothetical protein